MMTLPRRWSTMTKSIVATVEVACHYLIYPTVGQFSREKYVLPLTKWVLTFAKGSPKGVVHPKIQNIWDCVLSSICKCQQERTNSPIFTRINWSQSKVSHPFLRLLQKCSILWRFDRYDQWHRNLQWLVESVGRTTAAETKMADEGDHDSERQRNDLKLSLICVLCHCVIARIFKHTCCLTSQPRPVASWTDLQICA